MEYNTNVYPLLTSYNHTNQGVNPLIPADDGTDKSLAFIRGAGKYNPAPLFPQTTDNGQAMSNLNYQGNDNRNILIEGNLNLNPSGSVEIENSWETNINSELQFDDSLNSQTNYEHFDEYQRYALNMVRRSDPYILPYFFSKINVSFIQQSVIKYVKEARGITIKTTQDIDELLQIMIGIYGSLYTSNGILGEYGSAVGSVRPDPNTQFASILGNLNKTTIEKYVANVLSALNITEFYLNDISQLPMPFSRPTLVSNKGTKELGFVGFFENNHKFTNQISSFNGRDLLPGKIDSTTFGN